MSKPSHHPNAGPTPIHELYPVDTPVWLWSPFYQDWFPGYVSRAVHPGGPQYAECSSVFVRTAKAYAWVDRPQYLMLRNRDEDPCDEQALREKDYL